MNIASVIVAAGRSTRFGSSDKIFQPLLGRPVLAWSLSAFDSCPEVSRIVIAAGSHNLRDIENLAGKYCHKPWRVVEGGSERTDSVRNCLTALGDFNGIISIHDAARPGVTPELIKKTAKAAWNSGAAIAAIPTKDTIKQAGPDGTITKTLDRSKLWQAATPQMFRADVIRSAYARSVLATDDAYLVEEIGGRVALIQADETIMKITSVKDLAALSGMLGAGEYRTGFGYDIHQTDPSRPLFLGGVQIPEGPGLLGHSDADVICHAVADALLGGAALGDIGRHFPNTDPAYAGISSLKLLEETCRLVEQAGWMPVNIDAMLIAERPKISPYVDEMRELIAGALGMDGGSVSVKATTAEKQGPAGRGECMEAYAVTGLIRRLSQG